jgi:amino acid adenylation domain-containing protein
VAITNLPELLDSSARRRPNHVAVESPPNGSITYRELVALSDHVRDRLLAMGVQPGDRVGIYLRKSIDAVAALLGVMKAGAAYVPVDSAAPFWRSAYILHDCAVKVAFIEDKLVEGWSEETKKLGDVPQLIVIENAGDGGGLRAALAASAAPSSGAIQYPGSSDLAYILYTSGSTGKPKGVMLTHRNAMAFVDWCSDVFSPTDDDRFSSHAPFHFDLSILDLYVPLKHGATIVLIGAEQGKEPLGLAQLVADRKISMWYSTPSILSLLAQYGKMDRFQYPYLRVVNFAGEVFPVKHLRSVKKLWPHPRYYNLYGPTETNVCTYHEIPEHVEEDRTEPYPIGKVCEHYRARVVEPDGSDVVKGQEGELVIAGDGILQGYWNLPDNTARAFLVDDQGERWYHTGDVVIEGDDGVFTFVGRRDRMVKRRGYRIELGEVEAGLYKHPAVREAATVAVKDAEGGVRIVAFLSCKDGAKPSTLEMKRFSSENLPMSMIPDQFKIVDELPKTSTDKVDYQRLMSMT